MIEINGKKVIAGKFPDGTLLLKEKIADILQKTETGRACRGKVYR